MSDLWPYLTLTGEPVAGGPTRTEPTHVEEPLPLDDHRVRLDRAVTGKLFLQRATPGSTPDRDAYRNATILSQIAGRDVFPQGRPPAA